MLKQRLGMDGVCNDRQIVHRLKALKVGKQIGMCRQIAGILLVDDPVHGIGHILRRHGGAVVEFYVGTQLDFPGQLIGLLPALRQAGHEFHLVRMGIPHD